MKFATEDDVRDRFEGVIGDDRSDWLVTRITDVENVLMGLVPSLRKPLPDIIADSVACGDPGRTDRVVTLVCDKVLDMYRNPDRVTSRTQTVGVFSDTRAFSGSATQSISVTFTENELSMVRLRAGRRKLNTINVAPWRI